MTAAFRTIMKVDLMTKQELIQYYTNYWCKTKGITARDLETHPQIDDIIFMLKFRDLMWNQLNNSEQGIWAAYWSRVYHKKRQLHKKALKKFEQITITSTNRQEQLEQQRQLIKALRLKYSKPADNMTAKDAGPLQSVPWD